MNTKAVKNKVLNIRIDRALADALRDAAQRRKITLSKLTRETLDRAMNEGKINE